MIKHHCPICQIELADNLRYPNYICNSCAEKATDKEGRKLSFYNLDFAGGFEAKYQDTGEKYESHSCYINGIECYADEARFGGIVIEKI